MKLELNVSAAVIRKLDAICKHWSEARARINDEHPSEKPIPVMTRDEWFENQVSLEHDELALSKRRRRT